MLLHEHDSQKREWVPHILLVKTHVAWHHMLEVGEGVDDDDVVKSGVAESAGARGFGGYWSWEVELRKGGDGVRDYENAKETCNNGSCGSHLDRCSSVT